MRRKKVIIDTDTGVDDAMALLMALESHKKGEVYTRAAKLLLFVSGADERKF